MAQLFMKNTYHDTAQVCLNGHMVNDRVQSRPELLKKFCPDCGAQTIVFCGECTGMIQGALHSTSMVGGSDYLGTPARPQTRVASGSVRAYCHACGKPYPWTRARIDAAKALAAELDELSDADSLLLQSSIDDLVADTPRTDVAIVRFKKVMMKTGKQAADGFKRVLVNVVTEAVRKQLWS
jgi:hypothetical protein